MSRAQGGSYRDPVLLGFSLQRGPVQGRVGFVVLSSLPQGVHPLGNPRGLKPVTARQWLFPGVMGKWLHSQSLLPESHPHLALNSKISSTQSLRQDHLTFQLLLKTSWQLPGWKPSGTK